jgi:hypothetical protein
MTEPGKDSRSDGFRKVGEADRSDEFKDEREKLVTAIDAIITKARETVADGKGLPNGMPITVGAAEAARVRTDSENPTQEGAFLINQGGKFTFVVHTHADDGQSSRTLRFERDDVEEITARNEYRSSGTVEPIAEASDTTFSPGSSPRYLAYSVMNDGAVNGNFRGADGVHTTRPQDHPAQLSDATAFVQQLELEIFGQAGQA